MSFDKQKIKHYARHWLCVAGTGATLFFSFTRVPEKITFPTHLQKTILARLKESDSLCYYQCYCAISGNPPSYLNRDSAITTSLKNLITVTEKFVLTKRENKYRVRFYTSTFNNYPNNKYAYLKLAEKSYWNFNLISDTLLSDSSVLKLAALELKLRPITEYDFKVAIDNYPQIIINGKRVSEQRLVEGNYLIRRELAELNR